VTARLAAVFVLAGLFALAGCATKTYGRQSPLTESEKSSMTCRDIASEMAKTYDFMNQVGKGSQASAADVAAQLVDYGIGNEKEKKAAMDSAEQRLAQLKEWSISRKCSAPAG
jgi:hypothetical protein